MLKQEQTLTQLMELWDNKEKAQAIKLLKKSMSEESNSGNVEPSLIQDYVKTAMQAGFNYESLPDYPNDVAGAARNMFYKEDIRKVILELGQDLHDKTSTNEVLQAAWNEVEKARNLIEFRKAFRMYVLIMRAELYTKEDIVEYTTMIDELDKEVRELREYKRIYNEMFDVLTQDDVESGLVLRAKQMKEQGMTDEEVCKVFNIDRNRLKYLRKKYVFE
jgi:polyhydroxyalkanoate synthesis regulator phasin